jgi:hypothetical protein
MPLDYQHPELGQAAVPLLKYPAQANSSFGPYQGMILLNPGGPGPSGVEQALEYGSTIQVSLLDYTSPFDSQPISVGQK